jgi:hypothetical protein
MSELNYAIECGVQINTKELSDGTIQATWNNGQCVEIISIEEAAGLGLVNDNNDYSYLISNLPTGSGVGHKLRLIKFLDKHSIGKVYDCNLRIGNGDIVGTVYGTKGNVDLRQHVSLSSQGKQFFRMKVTKQIK